MIIEDGNMCVDTDKIARKYLECGRVFVHTPGKDDRVRFIDFLESEGFAWNEGDCTPSTDEFETGLPFEIDLAERRVGYMGSVTSAAAAAGSGVIMSDRDFYLLHSLHELHKQG